MALKTLMAAASVTAGAANTFTHGLVHAGVSRTPDYFQMIPIGTSNMTFSWTATWNSVAINVTAGAGTNVTVLCFVKQCHSIED